MTNKYLEKIAESDFREKYAGQHSALKDVKDTATIAGLGGIGGMLTSRILGHKEAFSPKAFAVGTGIGLAADYAGLKLNKATDKLLPKNRKEQNVSI